jgi:hypothetical protein
VVITDPNQIDFNLGINEVYTEVAAEIRWRSVSVDLADKARNAGTDLVYVTDAEGGELFLAARPVAEWICRELNQTCEICLTRCGKREGEACKAKFVPTGRFGEDLRQFRELESMKSKGKNEKA